MGTLDKPDPNKKHYMCCADCYDFIYELEPEEVGSGHKKIGEFENSVDYIGIDLCENCEWGWQDEEDEFV